MDKAKKGDIGINTLVVILLGMIVLSIIVLVIIGWKDKIFSLIGGISNVKVNFPF